MTTKTAVLNRSLVECGEPEMSGPSDTSTWVRRVSNRYPSVVLRLLERHPWNFARKRVALELLADEPIGREHAYNKPGDCLRICLVNNTGEADDTALPDYEDEAGQILTDMNPCYLFYVSSDWLVKEGSWPQVFADAVGLEIAAQCYALFGKDENTKQRLRKDADKNFSDARSWDAAQMPFKRNPSGLWVQARRAKRTLTGDRTT